MKREEKMFAPFLAPVDYRDMKSRSRDDEIAALQAVSQGYDVPFGAVAVLDGEDFKRFVITRYFEQHGKVPMIGSWIRFFQRAIFELRREKYALPKIRRQKRRDAEAQRKLRDWELRHGKLNNPVL